MVLARNRLITEKDLSNHEKKNLSILETVRRRAPIARADIARLIDLNIVTVTSYVDQYIKKGILKEIGVDISTGGRKPTLVDLDADVAFAIGVGLNAVDMIAVLCNLKGQVLSTVRRERPLESGEKLIQDMIELVGELMSQSRVEGSKVHGIGIGFPGIVNREANTVRWPSGLGKADLSISFFLSDKFVQRFGLPVLLDNDANTAAFSEQWHSNALDLGDVIYLYSGAGCGFMFGGRIWRGHSGSAGEWLFDLEQEHPEIWVQQSIQSGDWAIDLGIARRAQSEIERHPESKLYTRAGGNAQKIRFKDVVQCAQDQDAYCMALLSDAGRVLGRKAALLVNLLNPEMVIVGGGVEMGGLPFMNALKSEVERCAIPEATADLRIVPSQLGDACVPLGAAAMVIQNFFVES